MPQEKKYVVVLAHADGWGAVSADKVVRQLREEYPDLGIYLVVSQATRNKEGKIATKLDDLKIPRELKEENLLEYFKHIDKIYDTTPSFEQTRREIEEGKKPEGVSEEDLFAHYMQLGMQQAHQHRVQLLTFKQLAKRYCSDGEVHYTTKGGPKGGEEVAAVVTELEKQYGYGPEVLLSVDTMAILPAALLEKYQCFSTHPGPLDRIKIEGMQGTLRALVDEVFFDRKGRPIEADFVIGYMGFGDACLKGTLFMQHPELDKGPPIVVTLTPIYLGMCAYQARDFVYYTLTDWLLEAVPFLLNKEERTKLVERAMQVKADLDALPKRHVPQLEAEPFAKWQGKSVAIPSEERPGEMEVIQNAIIHPDYFKKQMRRFFPGEEIDFEELFTRIYGNALERLAVQQNARLTDPWARLLIEDPGILSRPDDPKIKRMPRKDIDR